MAEAELRAVRDELVAQGLVEGGDFTVLGTGEPTAYSSECIVLRGDADGWHVEYRDMGVSRDLLLSKDFSDARERFLREAQVLAAGRGRGPLAVAPKPTYGLEEFRERRRQGLV